MTGACVRVERDGKWESIEVDQLTDGELDALCDQQPERGWVWAKFLAKWIRDNIKEDE